MPVSAGCNDRVAEYHASGPYLFGGKAQGTIEELPVPHGAQTSCQMASGRKTADHDPGPVNAPFFTVVPYERHGTGQLHEGKGVASILDIIRAKGDKAGLEELVTEGSEGVLCAEAGGPTPGMGCAGRGIITAFEALEERHAFDIYRPDVVIYDVLGDVVCGGFAMPIREGYADKVFIVTSGENMAIYAAANIACAVKAFEARGYAGLGGLILNRRGVKREQEKAEELARDMGTDIIASLDFSPLVGEAEELGKTVMEVFPDSDIAGEYKKLADAVLAVCREEQVRKDNAKESA